MPNVAESTVHQVAAGLREGKTLRAACEDVGVSPGDALARASRNRRLGVRLAEAMETRTALVEDALYETAMKGNVTAQALFLCNRAPERWRPANSAKPATRPVDDEHVTPAELLARYAREDAEEAVAGGVDDGGEEVEAAAG